MTNIFIDGLIDSVFVLIPLAIVLAWVTWAIIGRITRQRRPINTATAHRSQH